MLRARVLAGGLLLAAAHLAASTGTANGTQQPGDPGTAIKAGIIKEARGDLDGAVADFTEAIRLARDPGEPPEAPDARRLLVRAYHGRGQALARAGKLRLARADNDEAIRLAPEDPQGYSGRAFTRTKAEDYRGAIADCTEALRRDPERQADLVMRGAAYLEVGEHRRAVADLTEAIRLDPLDFMAYHYRAMAHEQAGDGRAALADLGRAIELAPAWAVGPLHRSRGSMRYAAGDTDGAIDDYTKAIWSDPKDAASHFFRGVAWLKKGEREKSEADLTEAARLDRKFDRSAGKKLQ